MTKRDLIKVIPRFGEFISHAHAEIVDGETILLHALQRDGQNIWADLEWDNGLGRWLCPFDDLSRGIKKYIYRNVEQQLKTGWC